MYNSRNRALALAAVAAIMAIGGGAPPVFVVKQPQPTRRQEKDAARIAKAEAKRQRKAAKRNGR